MKLPDHPLALGIAIVCIIGAVVSGVYSFTGNGPVFPETLYHCDSCDKDFTASLSLNPACPTCRVPGLQTVRVHCRACKALFTIWDVKVLGPGKRQVRLVGMSEWLEVPPQSVACPTCRKKGIPGTDFPYAGKAVLSDDLILE